MKRLKLTTLKSKLMLLVMLCWVIPLILIGGYSVYYFYGDVNERIDNSIRYAAEYAGDITTQQIEDTISRSRDASYDLNIWNAYTTYQQNHDMDELNLNITSYLKTKYYFNQDFTFACVFLLKSPQNVYYVSENGLDNYDFYINKVHKQVIALSGKIETNSDFIVQDNKIYEVRNLMDKNTVKPYAVLVLQLDPKVIYNYFVDNSLWNGNVFFTLNGTSGVVGENVFSDTDKTLSALPVFSERVISTGREIEFYGKTKPDTDDFTFGYKVQIDKNVMFKGYRTLLNVILILVLTIFPLLIVVVLFFQRNISRPINLLLKVTQAMQSGRLGLQITKVHNDEFGYLIKTFNSMSRQIDDLVNSVLKEQLASKDSRILALESQINPHFLNNTLEMMNWRSRLQGDEQLSLMIESLSTILEAGMDRSQKRLIPLRQELGHADAYLYIMSMRFGPRLTVHKNVDESLLDSMVPRLIIQPLLENAIVHGLEPAGSTTVWLEITRLDDGLRIRIINSGKEIDSETLERLNRQLENEGNSNGRLGIANISERLRLIYGNKASLKLRKGTDGTTLAEIIVQDARISEKMKGQ